MKDTAAAECDARTIKESRGQREERLLGNSLARESRQLQPDRQTYGGIQLMDGDWGKGAQLMMTTGGRRLMKDDAGHGRA